jgi:O-acetylhomoserine/O-acetylserine sulfhydrylase-like pyridoxal-dependent enzyme
MDADMCFASQVSVGIEDISDIIADFDNALRIAFDG